MNQAFSTALRVFLLLAGGALVLRMAAPLVDAVATPGAPDFSTSRK